MKKIISLSAIFLFLTSCSNTTKTPILTQSGETISNTTNIEEVIPAGKGLEAAGTEPFWAFRLTDNQILWQNPGDNGVESDIINTTIGLSQNEILLTGSGFTASFTADIQCSDGMSDNAYDFSVNVEKNGVNYNGCGRWYNGETPETN